LSSSLDAVHLEFPHDTYLDCLFVRPRSPWNAGLCPRFALCRCRSAAIAKSDRPSFDAIGSAIAISRRLSQEHENIGSKKLYYGERRWISLSCARAQCGLRGLRRISGKEELNQDGECL